MKTEKLEGRLVLDNVNLQSVGLMDIFNDYDYEKVYQCTDSVFCNHFTRLMFLIINVNNIPNGYTVLYTYILSNQDEINKKNSNGLTALHIAAINSSIYNLETVKMLLKNGADVNSTDNIGWTALMMAARYSNKKSSLETVRLLLDKGANIDLTNVNGWTALMMAARYSNSDSSLETVKLLLEKGADVSLVDGDGWTALMMAARYSNTDSSLETVKLLLAKETNVNITNQGNNTALILATIDFNIETVKLLLENGADANVINKDNKTFFDYIPMEYLLDCLKIIDQIELHKLRMKELFVPIHELRVLYPWPDSFIVKIIGIRYRSSNSTLFEELKIDDPDLLDYFGITDKASLEWKIEDILKYIDKEL